MIPEWHPLGKCGKVEEEYLTLRRGIYKENYCIVRWVTIKNNDTTYQYWISPWSVIREFHMNSRPSQGVSRSSKFEKLSAET